MSKCPDVDIAERGTQMVSLGGVGSLREGKGLETALTPEERRVQL